MNKFTFNKIDKFASDLTYATNVPSLEKKTIEKIIIDFVAQTCFHYTNDEEFKNEMDLYLAYRNAQNFNY